MRGSAEAEPGVLHQESQCTWDSPDSGMIKKWMIINLRKCDVCHWNGLCFGFMLLVCTCETRVAKRQAFALNCWNLRSRSM